MEKICSECGKVCGSNARTIIVDDFGRFSHQTFCGFCFNKYKNDLEARLMNNFKQRIMLGSANLPPNFNQLSWQEKRPISERNYYQLKVLEEELRRLQKQYRELTGFDWIMPKF